MSRFRLRARGDKDPGDGDRPEDQEVRQYRFLLRTAPADALEAAHTEALPRLSAAVRSDLLRVVQETLMAGLRLSPGDHAALGHLMTLGERREPGVLLTAYPAASLHSLATELITTQAVFGLFAGYAEWDGADPEPEDDSAWADAGFNRENGRWSLNRELRQDPGSTPSAAGGWPDAAGGA